MMDGDIMLTLDEHKGWLRLEVVYTDEDTLLNSAIAFSVEEIHNSTGKSPDDLIPGTANKIGDTETYKDCQILLCIDKYENRLSSDGSKTALSRKYMKLKNCFEAAVTT